MKHYNFQLIAKMRNSSPQFITVIAWAVFHNETFIGIDSIHVSDNVHKIAFVEDWNAVYDEAKEIATQHFTK